MIRLLLTSNGFIDSPLEKDFLEMTGGKTNLKVALIPTAGDTIEWVPDTNNSTKFVAKLITENKVEKSKEYLYYKEKGHDVVIVDLKDDSEKIKEKLGDADIIDVCGGDVNYLLEWAKKSKLDTYFKDLLDKGVVYVGTSAGSCLLTPDIGFTWWEPNDPTDHVGLKITDFILIPHQKESDESKSVKKCTERKKYLQTVMDFPWKVYLLQDGQAFFHTF
jgi:peptidase E